MGKQYGWKNNMDGTKIWDYSNSYYLIGIGTVLHYYLLRKLWKPNSCWVCCKIVNFRFPIPFISCLLLDLMFKFVRNGDYPNIILSTRNNTLRTSKQIMCEGIPFKVHACQCTIRHIVASANQLVGWEFPRPIMSQCGVFIPTWHHCLALAQRCNQRLVGGVILLSRWNPMWRT